MKRKLPRPQKTKRNGSLRLGRAWLLSVVTLLVFSMPSAAHSYLAAVDPPLGTTFDTTPESIALIFTQGPDNNLSEFELQDEHGEVIRSLTPTYEGEDQSRVVLPLEVTLDPGHYQVAWLAVSTTDGHPTRGIVPLAIGVAATSSLQEHNPANEIESPSPIRIVVRWFVFVSMLLLVGALWFPLIVPKSLEENSPPHRSLLLSGVLIMLVSGLLDVMMQSQQIGVSTITILLESQWGQHQLVKYLLALFVGILVWVDAGNRWRIVTQLTALLMLATQALASHNANLGQLGALADWVHMLAGALWLGGLVQLAWIWLHQIGRRSHADRTIITKTLLNRFSQLALVSVVLILISGVYAAYHHLNSWDALLNSMYGRALVAKGLLLLPVLGMALVNRKYLLPQLGSTDNSGSNSMALSKLRRMVFIEALVIVVILFFASVLTNVSPPLHQHGAHAEEQHPLVLTHEEDNIAVTVQIMPPDGGNRLIAAKVLDQQGNPLKTVLRLSFEFNYLDENLGDTFFQHVAEETEDGFQLFGSHLTLSGAWQFKVIVRIRQRAQDLEIDFPIEVSSDGKVHAAQADAHEENDHHDD